MMNQRKSRSSGTMQLFYTSGWAGRCTPVLHILSHAKAEYELPWVEEFRARGIHKKSAAAQQKYWDAKMKSKAFVRGAKHSPIMGFPILRDGDLEIGQTTLIAQYLAKKLNLLPAGKENQWRAQQYVEDFYEIHSNIFMSYGNGKVSLYEVDNFIKNVMPKYVALANNQIQGPYYFGEQPCYVDYFVAGLVDLWTKSLSQCFEAGYYKNPFKVGKLGEIHRRLGKKGEQGFPYPADVFPRTKPAFQVPWQVGYAATASWYNPMGYVLQAGATVKTSLKGKRYAFLTFTVGGALVLGGLLSNLYLKWF